MPWELSTFFYQSSERVQSDETIRAGAERDDQGPDCRAGQLAKTNNHQPKASIVHANQHCEIRRQHDLLAVSRLLVGPVLWSALAVLALYLGLSTRFSGDRACSGSAHVPSVARLTAHCVLLAASRSVLVHLQVDQLTAADRNTSRRIANRCHTVSGLINHTLSCVRVAHNRLSTVVVPSESRDRIVLPVRSCCSQDPLTGRAIAPSLSSCRTSAGAPPEHPRPFSPVSLGPSHRLHRRPRTSDRKALKKAVDIVITQRLSTVKKSVARPNALISIICWVSITSKNTTLFRHKSFSSAALRPDQLRRTHLCTCALS